MRDQVADLAPAQRAAGLDRRVGPSRSACGRRRPVAADRRRPRRWSRRGLGSGSCVGGRGACGGVVAAGGAGGTAPRSARGEQAGARRRQEQGRAPSADLSVGKRPIAGVRSSLRHVSFPEQTKGGPSEQAVGQSAASDQAIACAETSGCAWLRAPHSVSHTEAKSRKVVIARVCGPRSDHASAIEYRIRTPSIGSATTRSALRRAMLVAGDADGDAFGRQADQRHRIVGFEAHQRLQSRALETRDRPHGGVLRLVR